VGEKNEQGLQHGQGKMAYANGEVYEGQWEAEHGQGKYVYASGQCLEGQWQNDKFCPTTG
jgi:hypothetical protein